MTQHLFDSLQAAARLAVIQPDYQRGCIITSRWATTYRCSESDVEDALKLAENGSRRLPEEVAAASQSVPQIDGEGK